MSFADSVLTEDLAPLRQQLLQHPLWAGIEARTLGVERLRLFALQDYWLVREAYRLDALAIAAAPDLETQELLMAKLFPKQGGYKLLWRFGEAIGLTQADFEAVEPLAGCMALTNFFYWMLAYGSPGEKLASVSASEDIFIQICARVGPALMRNYGMSAAQAEFFTAHDQLREQVSPLDEKLVARYAGSQYERQLITRAVRLSHEYELMFYDTIMNVPT